MKKLKMFMLMAALSIMLCACGDKEEELSGDSANGNDIVVEQTAGEKEKDKSDKKVEHFECLPELLESSPEDRLIQIGDVVLRFDGTMSLKEVVETLENSSIEYEVKCKFGSSDEEIELNMDRLIPGGEIFELYLMENGEKFLSFAGGNLSLELVSVSDDSVIIELFFRERRLKEGEFFYFFGGIRSDGNGLTMDSVKELMAEYDVVLEERSTNDSYILSYSYEWEDPMGKEYDGYISFSFDLNDGSCNGVSFL